jgi:hypothetical protein
MKPESRSVRTVLAALFAGGGLAVTACQSAPPTPPPAAAPVATTTGAEAPLCDLHCEGAEVTPMPQRPQQPDHHAAAVANANQVLSAMHGDLLACYKDRVKVVPAAHAFMTIDVVINPDGTVRAVETTGGALLGDASIKCIVDRVKKATFAPVKDGGTLRIHAPFSLRKVTPAESI